MQPTATRSILITIAAVLGGAGIAAIAATAARVGVEAIFWGGLAATNLAMMSAATAIILSGLHHETRQANNQEYLQAIANAWRTANGDDGVTPLRRNG